MHLIETETAEAFTQNPIHSVIELLLQLTGHGWPTAPVEGRDSSEVQQLLSKSSQSQNNTTMSGKV